MSSIKSSIFSVWLMPNASKVVYNWQSSAYIGGSVPCLSVISPKVNKLTENIIGPSANTWDTPYTNDGRFDWVPLMRRNFLFWQISMTWTHQDCPTDIESKSYSFQQYIMVKGINGNAEIAHDNWYTTVTISDPQYIITHARQCRFSTVKFSV